MKTNFEAMREEDRIMKKSSTLTDMLSNLISVSEKSEKERKELEYAEYLLSRSG